MRAENLENYLKANPGARGANGGRLRGNKYKSPTEAHEAHLQQQRDQRQWLTEDSGSHYPGKQQRYKTEGERYARRNQGAKISKRRKAKVRLLEGAARTHNRGDQ